MLNLDLSLYEYVNIFTMFINRRKNMDLPTPEQLHHCISDLASVSGNKGTEYSQKHPKSIVEVM